MAAKPLTSQRAKLLEDYIRNNPDSKLPRKEKYLLKGVVHELDVYRLPLNLVAYNISNGRFAAELREKEAELKRQLNPEEPEDARVIEELLLSVKHEAQFLRNSLVEKGQDSPAAVSYDGRIIDGNRRAAVLKSLSETQAKYGYLEAVRLPQNLDPKDLWRIEAGISLGHQYRVSYGPINELLKIKEGKDAGLGTKEIASTLSGNETKEIIDEKLERLRLIEDYLQKTGTPGKYSEAERRVEHFINLQSLMRTSAYKALPAETKARFLDATYDAILHGVAHLEIRSLRKVLDKKTVNEFIAKHGKIKEEQGTSAARTREPRTGVQDEVAFLDDVVSNKPTPKPPAKATPSPIKPKSPPIAPRVLRQRYKEAIAHAVDAAAAKDEKDKPGRLVDKAKTAVSALAPLTASQLKPFAKDLKALEAQAAKFAKRANSQK